MLPGMARLFLLILLVACSSDHGSTAPPPSPLADPHRWDCAKDSDCVNSCHWGAVNATWYRTSSQRPDFQECEDGCANQLSEAPRCESGSCVAYQSDPRDETKISRADDCTHKP